MDEPLISLRPQTDFEKLIWEQNKNRELAKKNSELAIELGKSNAKITELEDKLTTQAKEILEQVNGSPKKLIEQNQALRKRLENETKRVNKGIEERKTMQRTINDLIAKIARNGTQEKK
jgi:hypothetical protein